MLEWINSIRDPNPLRISRADLEERLRAFDVAGYKVGQDTKKLTLFQKTEPARDVYLDKCSKEIKIVVDPGFKDLASSAAEGCGQIASQLFHNSNMRRFPERKHTGQGTTRCGVAIRFDTVGALRDFLLAFGISR